MLGVRTSQVFNSRWKALVWSAGVLLTAYCSIPAADGDAVEPSKQGQSNEQERQARDLIEKLDALKGR